MNKENNHCAILIKCPDSKGLVYKITELLYKNNLNIISNDEFVDPDSSIFFMRTIIDGLFDKNNILAKLKICLPKKSEIFIHKNKKKKLIIMATKEPHCLGDILIRTAFNEFNAEIQSIIANHNTLSQLSESFNIPFHYVPHHELTRREHEKKIEIIISKYNPDYIILAKYMRILSPEFIKNFKNKIINIHHSFLPAFIGANPYKQAYQRGVKIIGATTHFVTDNLDEGPIISQNVTHIKHALSVEDMSIAGYDIEKITLSQTLKLLLEHRIFINDKKTVVFD